MRSLPEYPFDRIAPYRATAERHPGGLIDLSMGTPVDPVPESIRKALADRSDRPGYPMTAGTPELRRSIRDWLARHCHTPADDGPGVLPTIGSKEAVAWLPTLLDLGPGDAVVFPRLSYPTYEIGARLAGADLIRADDPAEVDHPRVRLVWLNSPGNPTGEVLSAARLTGWVEWSRERGAIVVDDECYHSLGWEAAPASILDPAVSGPVPSGVLAVHSLSKRSNLAGYRAGFIAGDAALIEALLQVRKHAGMIVPTPVQAAMVEALTDESHAEEQRERYRRRRDRLATALRDAGWRIDHSEAGLYLWVTDGRDCWEATAAFAELGVLVVPGEVYGPDGDRHVRIALTVTDAQVTEAVTRLATRPRSALA
ncbi:succinyldiaminopimelate aminotransferase [Stackebrandtia albiflava]|uniref:Aminotransferase n=1 Tax=Stackebrandtia albiflava TaxID=406432 RepID=A0A562UPS8_9ACTN|nr:succinyldiaminopimelate transaminase [Stackebrandtia albiflava]TWJ07625.1 succinyldiaminopimelate aminotransferase [Stackebrandtia albiflava]